MKHKKTVHVLGYEFDSLPAHVKVSGRGSGATLRVACQRAIADLFTQHQLRHKQTGAFKLSVVVIAAREPDDLDRSIVPRPSAAADDALGTPQSVIERRPKPGNCGDCLMEHAAIVPLRPDRTCACCESGHRPARGKAVRA